MACGIYLGGMSAMEWLLTVGGSVMGPVLNGVEACGRVGDVAR